MGLVRVNRWSPRARVSPVTKESMTCHPAYYHHHDKHQLVPKHRYTSRHQSMTNGLIYCSMLRNTASTMPARQTVSTKRINFTATSSTTMGTPRCRPRAILKDSLSSLVPKEGSYRKSTNPITRFWGGNSLIAGKWGRLWLKTVQAAKCYGLAAPVSQVYASMEKPTKFKVLLADADNELMKKTGLKQ